MFAAIQADIDSLEEYDMTPQAIEAREQLIKKYKSVLHPKNAYLTILRSTLGTLYGKVEQYMMDELPDLLLERKIEFCREVLKVLDIIEPGYTRIRGK